MEEEKRLLKEIVYIAIVVMIFLVILRNLITSPPYSMLDTEPPPPSPSFPQFFSPSNYGTFGEISPSSLLEFAFTLLGTLNAVKIETILPFIIGTLAFHFMSKEVYVGPKKITQLTRTYKNFVIYVLPFFFVINPINSTFLYLGDSPGILFASSFIPLVFLFSYKLLKETTLRNFALLSIFTVVSNLVYFEGFLFSFIFEFPILLLSLLQRKFRVSYLLITSIVISFMSELSEELYTYLVIVPSDSAPFKITYDIFIYSVMVFSIIVSIVLLTWNFRLSKEKTKDITILSLILTSSLVMFLFLFLLHYPIKLPLIGSLILTITTFPQKVFLFSFELILLALPFFRFTWLVFLIILISVFFPTYSPLNSTYQELSFSTTGHEVIPQFYQVYGYLESKDPYYLIVQPDRCVIPTRLSFQTWPGFVDLAYYNSQIAQMTENSSYGIKYVITFSPINDSNLTLITVFKGDPSVYLYKNNLYQGLILYPNGTRTGGNFSIEGDKIIINLDNDYTGNVILLFHHSYFWDTNNYHNLVEVYVENGRGTAYFSSYFSFLYITLSISAIFFILPFIMLLYSFIKKKT
jgi:hypothetical protein